MGYMGLARTGDSDNAWDFQYNLLNAIEGVTSETNKSKKYDIIKSMNFSSFTKENKKKFSEMIKKELKNKSNGFNTSGDINICFMIEDGLVKKEDIDDETYDSLIDHMKNKVSESGPSCSESWNDEENRVEHHEAYKRLLNSALNIK